jgi:cell wall assembly regulator SMI1
MHEKMGRNCAPSHFSHLLFSSSAMRTVQTAREPTGGQVPKNVAPSTLRLIVERVNKMTNVEAIIGRLRRASVENFPGVQAPSETLAPGISSTDIEEFETKRCLKLPDDVKQYFQCANGQAGSDRRFSLPGLYLMPLKESIKEMESYGQYYDGPSQSEMSIPPRAIQGYYFHANFWIPLAHDFAADYVAVDLDPGPEGKYGQVIICGKGYIGRYCVVADSWSEFLDDYVSFIEKGEGFDGFQDPIIYMGMIYSEKVKEIREKKLLGH